MDNLSLNKWKEYELELRNVLTNPESGTLLKANEFTSNLEDSNCYFELTSKKYCKEFISIFEGNSPILLLDKSSV